MDLSLAAQATGALRVSLPSQLTLMDASAFASAHVPPFPPEMPALILGINSEELALKIKGTLLKVYPNEHAIYVVEGGESKEEKIGVFSNFSISDSVCWFIPALGEGTSFESFAGIVAHLRAPNGCPWDREQTHESLRRHLLEETYETIAAIDSGDSTHMCEEFGDLLLQIVLHAQIASEDGRFNITQVIQGIYSKIVRRHPHVFSDVKVDDADEVLANWEKLKEKERGKKKDGGGLLDGVSLILPALTQAQEYQSRAVRVGFNWGEIDGVLDKIKEEIEEIKHAETNAELASEIGDLFFVLVNFALWKKLDAESALRGTNAKFKRRFSYVEQGARKQGRVLSELTLSEMDALWQEAKGLERR
ncbi:MAG: nucleoside triphosphate pyrophosphohydrolase [Anaerolineaceae bacterium]|jgi:tetrapyrrole methylase family protein/MazG family protein|nr:nucleoside triphosphate pyrophosphohydrolase [Anaerolineaceae bacterium]